MTTSLKLASDYRVDELFVAEDVAYMGTIMVNVFFVGPRSAGDREWVLVDAGMSG